MLRQSSPGQYESYVDLEPGAWTRLRIEVDGTRISADAHFSNLRVTPRARGTSAPRTEEGSLPEVAEVVNGSAERVSYRGRPAVRLVPAATSRGKDEAVLALLALPEFRNGSIEVELAGTPRPGAPSDSRGFVGISFRTEDQVRRNRSMQYAFDPEFPWHRLRRESPGVYEAYADLEDGAWTRIRVEESGATAQAASRSGRTWKQTPTSARYGCARAESVPAATPGCRRGSHTRRQSSTP